MNQEILISISCITYNHKAFIKDCLDGFLKQQTNFSFEIIIHDDASTDGTADIIREYEAKYPNIIKPIYQTENQYSKGVRGINPTYCFPRAQGKYIALCEGDDYWTDPYKLQKQVDFLEANQDFSMCFHNFKIFNCEDNTFSYRKYFLKESMEFSPEELFLKWPLQTATIVFKKELLDDMRKYQGYWAGDILLVLILIKNGRVFGLSDEMSLYRIHNGGISNSLYHGDVNALERELKQLKVVERDFGYLIPNALRFRFSNIYIQMSLSLASSQFTKASICLIKAALKYDFIFTKKTIKLFCQMAHRRLKSFLFN